MKNTYCNSIRNKIPVKNRTRSYKMPTSKSKGNDSIQKKYKLVIVFPEKASETEAVKEDVKKILSMELKHQLQH